MLRKVQSWTIAAVVLVALLAGSASVQTSVSSAASGSYKARVGAILDRYKRQNTPLSTAQPAPLRREALASGRAAARAAASLDRLHAPADWRNRHRRAARSLRKLSTLLAGVASALKGKKTPADTQKMWAKRAATFFRASTAADNAVTALAQVE